MPTPSVATPIEKAVVASLWEVRNACFDAVCAVGARVETDTVLGAVSLHFYHGPSCLSLPISNKEARDGDGAALVRAVRKWARAQHPTPLWVPHTVPND